MNTAEVVHLTIETEDGVQLAASLWDQNDPGAVTVMIASATGVPRRFYRHFATYLQAEGIRILTLDYRAIGESSTDHPRRSKARLSDWGAFDCTAAIRWLRKNYPNTSVTWLGHSVGGQILGFVPRADQPDRLIAMCAQSGYWRNWPGFSAFTMWSFWHVIIPLFSSTLGYLPGWIMGGDPLPKGVVKQWARWSKQPDYVLTENEQVRSAYAELKIPTLIIHITDDWYAPRQAVEALAAWLPDHPDKHTEIWQPADADRKKLGHFGFFRLHQNKPTNPLWQKVSAWLRKSPPG